MLELSIPQLVMQLFLLACQTPASGLCVVVITWVGNKAKAVFHKGSWNVYIEWGCQHTGLGRTWEVVSVLQELLPLFLREKVFSRVGEMAQ